MAVKSTDIKHIGVIMDGNRRWAKAHLLQTVLGGHEKGANKFIEFCEWCKDYNIEHITAFIFSYENWNRSSQEVQGLFKLMEHVYINKIDYCIQNKMHIHPVGNMELLSPKARKTLMEAEEKTRNTDDFKLHAAISYGGRDEYVRMAKKIAQDVKEGKLEPDQIDQALVRSYLDMGDAPDIDLVIRTGGDKRLSGFFPWHTSYSELYFLDVLWPDLSREMFDEVINQYCEKVRINHGK